MKTWSIASMKLQDTIKGLQWNSELMEVFGMMGLLLSAQGQWETSLEVVQYWKYETRPEIIVGPVKKNW